MKRVLVTGINGQLGYDVLKELNERGYTPVGVDRENMDLTDLSNINNFIKSSRVDAVIHCAAYTAVDNAEDNEKICEIINGLSVKEIANACKDLDIPLVYISTDYVFDGSKKGKYIETDKTNPINVYGKTKLMGEEFVKDILDKYFIVRISWVFGENGNNFINTMLRLSKEHKELNIINDQVGSPTYTKDLAPLLVDMIETNKYGTYNVTNEDFCSWYEFAKEIFKIKNIDIKVNPINTSEYKTKAKRPLNSKMSKEKLEQNGFKRLRTWQEALKDYLKYKGDQ